MQAQDRVAIVGTVGCFGGLSAGGPSPSFQACECAAAALAACRMICGPVAAQPWGPLVRRARAAAAAPEGYARAEVCGIAVHCFFIIGADARRLA